MFVSLPFGYGVIPGGCRIVSESIINVYNSQLVDQSRLVWE